MPMFEPLGANADEVADSLRLLAIRGMPGATRFLNPVVKYAATQLEVDALGVELVGGAALSVALPDGGRQEVPLRRPVAEFVARFDRGQYPDLVMPFGTGRG